MEAEKLVPDLSAAMEFLLGHELIPGGDNAFTGESLISGLLHLAFSTTGDLAKRGILAFAHLAKGVLDHDAQTAVSDAVIERAEGQLRLRLDHHTSHVEDRLDEFSEMIGDTPGTEPPPAWPSFRGFRGFARPQQGRGLIAARARKLRTRAERLIARYHDRMGRRARKGCVPRSRTGGAQRRVPRLRGRRLAHRGPRSPPRRTFRRDFLITVARFSLAL